MSENEDNVAEIAEEKNAIKMTDEVNIEPENEVNVTSNGNVADDENLKASESNDEVLKIETENKEALPEVVEEVSEYSENTTKGKAKADKDLQHIHIALPRDVFEKLEIGKKAYYNNKTTYIRNLILNDYEKNKKKNLKN